MITCARCEQEKPDEAFSPSNRAKNRPWCRECYRAYNAERWANRSDEQREVDAERKRRWKDEHREEVLAYHRNWNAVRPGYKRAKRLERDYGITADQVAEMEREQGGVCAICRRAPNGRGPHARLCVDHCHATNRVRGLLCSRCNTALGQLADDTERMYRMIEYLTKGGDLAP